MPSPNKSKRLIKVLMFGVIIIVLCVMAFLVFANAHSKTTTTSVPRHTYVALGDSVAAGLGLTTDSDSSACGRTKESYPNLVANSKDFILVNVACSGATMSAGILGSQDVNNLTVQPQLEQLFNQPKPELISITIGANDVGWSEFLMKCYTSTCGTSSDTAKVDLGLQTLASNLNTMLSGISNHYAGAKPQLVLTGYQQVFPPTKQSCMELIGIDQSELDWVNTQLLKINTTIKNSVIKYPFARFGGVDFAGHELCSASSWVQDINSRAPFHPNEDGQPAFAQVLQ